MAARILVVEDDADVASVVRAYLEREGYAVEVAHDGLAGLRAAQERTPALIVLDWMLPHLDGPSFLARLRRDAATPVIMLTARIEESDRVLGLELGADDYVAKPFSPRELVARVKAVLRRTSPPEGGAQETIEHAGLHIDPARRTVRVQGRPVALTALEFDLLHVLARTPGRVFSRTELLDAVWGEDFMGVDRVVDVHVSNLRHKLAAAGADGRLATVRGVGYKLEEEPS
ncbi:MAG: response regulator transcription factor [Trueperaceae bacterium]|nr:response regulator transcription factor [Trueperaceae bacterium]